MDTGKPDGRILRRGRLRLDLLHQLAQRPAPFENRERDFWRDPYVSQHVLEAHLDPHTDDATRRPAIVGSTVETILSHLGTDRPFEQLHVLDLACGPGLYAEQFAARGFQVTAIDYAEPSIRHARGSAERDGLTIDYRIGDLRATPLGGPYDLVMLIYGALSTFSDSEQRQILDRVRQAMSPGGLIVFDVFTQAYARRNRSDTDWYVSMRDGFWQEEPHLVLEHNFFYDGLSASVARYLIIEESGAYRTYDVWWRHFTREEILERSEDAGFSVEAVYGSLWGDPCREDDEWIGVYARLPRVI